MTTNRLAKSEVQIKRSQQEWIERGNAYLWGDAPAEHGKHAGTYIDQPRRDLQWACVNGNYFIERK
jgi:hypothetical protein